MPERTDRGCDQRVELVKEEDQEAPESRAGWSVPRSATVSAPPVWRVTLPLGVKIAGGSRGQSPSTAHPCHFAPQAPRNGTAPPTDERLTDD